MGFVYHGIQGKHDAWNFHHPLPGGQIFQQASSEHVVHGPVAALVDRIALWMVWRGEDSLDPKRVSQLAPDLTNKLSATIGQQAARCAKVWHDMAQQSVTHCVCCVIAGGY